MTEPNDAASSGPELSSLRLAELQSLAQQMGLRGTSRMRKGDLIAAIRGGGAPGTAAAKGEAPARTKAEGAPRASVTEAAAEAATASKPAQPRDGGSRRDEGALPDLGITLPEGGGRENRGDVAGTERDGEGAQGGESEQGQRGGRRPRRATSEDTDSRRSNDDERRDGEGGRRSAAPDRAQALRELEDLGDAAERRAREQREGRRGDGDNRGGQRDGGNRDNNRDNNNRDDERGGRSTRSSRRRDRQRDRQRDRRNRNRGRGDDIEIEETEVGENENLSTIAGILDVGENHGFIRTSGYLPGKNDVYVTLNQIRRNGLRKGDAVLGAVRAKDEDDSGNNHGGGGGGRRNQNRQKYTPLVRLDSVNGMSVEQAKARPEFSKLTPLYPTERLRLETTPKAITPRVIDLVAPIGKGQRGLIVSPPKAGKTIVMQQLANAISVNDPEVHLMVVLVDERPEEVTDMQRTVKGEVIASTFDRPAADHTTVAELAIERAKRLVELGQDVVVLLDSLTRLSRAYNIAAPASGRILSGGVDASALYPPKRFFGAARNIENGGSLTIIASALVETGSKMDEVIFEEFKGTGNMELRLSRTLAERRIFPAVDVNASGTRREEWLMQAEELKIIWKLRRVMGALDVQSAADLLLGKMRETQSNAEFLMTVQKTTPGMKDDQN